MHRPLPHAAGVLAENRRHYELVVEMVRHYADQGDDERMLRAVTVAASYAWLAPVGLLSDLRLERAVVHAVRGSGRVTVDGDRWGGRVLHVLSEAYAIGGHTRQVTQWIKRDEHTSDVVLTNQHGPAPDRLVESVRANGGRLHDLRRTTPSLLDRARLLRQHMDNADLVVLTVHPYDAVALAAVNLPGARPPVVYANHADLSFWLGVAGADLLCDWRPAARALDVGLRAVPGERVGVLPLPVEPMPSSPDETLRRRLGLSRDALVAVTVADNWKVAAAWGRGMHHLVDKVLRWSPQLSMVLVGVSPNPDWDRLVKRYPGRVVTVGKVPDPGPYLALADVYLESYPVRAGTTPLEAAAVGLPVLALADVPEDSPAHVFQTGSPGLAGIPVSSTAEQFAVTVRRLLDPDLRRRQGDEVRAAVLGAHDGPGWRASLEAVYERARSLPAIDVDDLGDSPTDDRYGAMMLSAVFTEDASPDPQRLAGPLGELFDAQLEADLLAVSSRSTAEPFRVRVAPGWEEHEEWTGRLLELSSTHPRLAVSLPFLRGDDFQGTRTEATLVRLLEGIGRTPADCGEVSVEVSRPHQPGPGLPDDAPFTGELLDWLARLMASPLWSPAGTDPGQPAQGARTVLAHA